VPAAPRDDPLVAYFSAEFGADPGLPIYAGGLGILAGDHLKSASDLAVAMVGVGLMYREGYFRQRLAPDGAQVEEYPGTDPAAAGAVAARGADGVPVEVLLDLAGQPVRAAVWRLDVGRTPLLLLDADVEGNPRSARVITARLYGGDRETRIRQELLLGIGGVRALAALGLRPTVFHLNEGHSAFLALERLRALMADGLDRESALSLVRATSVFTTHTPVPAGNEVFAADLARRYLAGPAGAIGIEVEEVLTLGRVDAADPGFGLTPLALRTCGRANAVSALHAEVAREMWRALWPRRPVSRVPIGHVTNGVHPPTWVAPALREHLEGAGEIPEAELWSLHREAVTRLVRHANRHGRAGRGGPRLDPEALTIGFARRFATYKRAGLLFHDIDRLARILGDPVRPAQVVVAGKAHPADADGKALLRAVAERADDPRLDGRVVVLADYDMRLGAIITQGVDVWLNTPLRPLEASGTSGMKAGMNGGLNCSVLDGWWAEAYAPDIGWAIGADAEAGDDGGRDAADAESLYAVLEGEVVPRFYDRDADGLPRAWLAMMRAAIARVGRDFSAHRMLREYRGRYYLPAHRDGQRTAAALRT
jgi:starch phosphorylase